MQGTDVYFYPGSIRGEAFADLIAHNFKAIYPYPELVGTTPSSSLYELRETIAPAAQVEVAYHDNYEDALWISQNTAQIGKALAVAVAQYFGLPCREPGSSVRGKVSTDGFAVYLRSEPNWAAHKMGIVQNGTELTVLGEKDGWCHVEYNGMDGYISKQYIVIIR